MPHWSLLLLVFALVAGVIGFGSAAAGTAAGAARFAFFALILVFALSVLMGAGWAG